ncbi:MAG TPA: ketose 1,6-bisphosphate aldolase [Bacteroidota bacterium]|nr:ketose 1,6-bisphosphate aldolase [Bacteroidota bacterium]
MPLLTLKDILDPASRQAYAVGAFNVISLEYLEAIVSAAERLRSPVILNVAEVHLAYINLDVITPAILHRARHASVPIALNLDHGLKFETIVRAVRNGFSSVMFDGSHLPFEENIAQTREVTRLCHAVNVSVEAELGAVGGSEGGELVGTVDPNRYTDPAQAEEFVRQTGIDALAIAFGNAHGKYKGAPMLDFARLDAIKKSVGIPLVLHGGSGIPDEDFKKAISLGIAKVNYFTGMAQASIDTLKTAITHRNVELKYNAYPDLMLLVQNNVSAVVAAQMAVFGSVGKA